MNKTTHPLCETVQKNCDISDAHHAANYTLCVYLLKMREYYRWENGFSYSDNLPKEDVGNWVQERETLWEEIENQSFIPLKIDNKEYDPFDTENINKALAPKGYVYSGGTGMRSAPHFFLAKLEEKQEYNDFTMYVSADECARDLTAPPAMTQGKNVFIRREALRRYLWEKFTEWQWHKYENAMSRALSFYDFENDVDHALDQMTDNELEAVTLHEIGEFIATKELGDDWREMIVNLPRSRAEFLARAVKDLLADCLSTLPGLIENYNPASLHFYAANLVTMRKELFPSFHNAYQTWVETDDLKPLKSLVAKGTQHWRSLANEMLANHRSNNEFDLKKLEDLVQSNTL
ncbi:MAG: Sfum_1244 family protein [Pseudomonadota bacterium]